MTFYKYDVIILGGGMVGLSIAHQLIARGITKSIAILEKEAILGLHSSGRNSGVLHSGLYYKPGSLKAEICVNGAKKLRQWIEARQLPINNCGKVVVPTSMELDKQLEELADRGKRNGAIVEFFDEKQLKEVAPEARSASGRALWSKNTAVVNPKKVIARLKTELESYGVKIYTNKGRWKANPLLKQVCTADGERFNYGHLFNCTGLQADRIARDFGVGENYSLLPFKGLYWQLKPDCPIQPKTNIYPVPDLNMPFLGVHFTPSADQTPIVSIGPTATPALGRENYRKLEAIEPIMATKNLLLLAKLYIGNKGGFNRYVHEQATLAIRPMLLRSARKLIPNIKSEHIEMSKKVGIRSQLFNHSIQRLEDDFLCINGPNSTHVLNAISPAFTASFALADIILNKSELR